MEINPNQYGITIVGLGPGEPELITQQAWSVLERSREIYVRTSQHPALKAIKPEIQLFSFDDFYEQSATFQDVYRRIVEKILDLGRRQQGVVYGVPGNPFVAEITSLEIYRQALSLNLPVRVVAGMSFLEPLVIGLGLDPFQNCVLIDALELSEMHVPSFSIAQPAIVAQIYSRTVASNVKLTLMSLYPDEHPVRLVHAAGTSYQLVEDLKLFEIDRSSNIGLLSSLFVPAMEKDYSFEAFLEIVARLRAPDGCPWDREQTRQSLRPYLLEETYELLHALDENDPQKICEELGDLLLQVLLHSQISNEEGEFSISDVLKGINRKIVHRHPHVFGDITVDDSQMVIRNWERIKQAEREENGQQSASMLDGVSITLPALSQADQYQRRAARVGFDWCDIQGVQRKVVEELEEVNAAENDQRRAEEIGDLLFSIVNLARWNNIDAESALRQSNARFRKRFALMEKYAKQNGIILSDLTLSELDELWERAKTGL
jgi:tetrapyrrole methylase family protein/MazG family protein